MRNFCTKCGTKLDDVTKLCPNCNALPVTEPKTTENLNININPENSSAKKRKNRGKFALKICLIIILIAAIILGASFGALYGIKYFKNKRTALNGGTSILSDFKADICDIQIYTKTNVLFTVQVNDDEINTSSLMVETAEGVALANMNDDGKDGDKKPDDGIFSCTVELISEEIGGVSYKAVCDEIVSDSFVIGFYKDILRSELDDFENLVKTVNELEYFDDIVEHISDSEIVKSYHVVGEKITYVGKCGITAVYEFVDKNSKGGGEYHVPAEREVDYQKATRNLKDASFNINSSLKKSSVLVIRPFRSSAFKYDDFLSAGEFIASVTGGSLATFDDSRAIVDVFKTFNQYKAVLIDSHGKLKTTDDGEIPYIYTGQYFNKNLVKDFSDWQSGRLIICGNTVAVGANFFEKYYEENSLKGSMFFLGTCHSMYDDSIAKVLCKKGASVVFGFTDTVSPDYCNKALFESVVNSLILSSYNSKKAVSEVGNNYGQTDPDNSKCEFRLYGDSDFYITYIGSLSGDDEVPSKSINRDVVILVDTSDDIIGMPFNDIKANISALVTDIIADDARIAIVSYNDRAVTLTEFTVYKKITYVVDKVEPGGDCNLYAGLKAAEGMLESSKANDKVIVVLSGSNPNKGRLDDNLLDYTNKLKENNIDIYSIGYFKYAKNDRVDGQSVLEEISTFGCHYEAKDANQLGNIFSKVAEKIAGEKSIYLKISGSSDVSLTYGDETISSNDNETDASFGSLELMYTGEEEGNTIKVFRLKAGLEYKLSFKTFKHGRINYMVAFPNDKGEYIDIRDFTGIKLNKNVSLKSTVNSSYTTLEIDSDCDGRYEERLVAGVGESGRKSLTLIQMIIVAGGILVVVVIIITLIVFIKRKKRKKIEKVNLPP